MVAIVESAGQVELKIMRACIGHEAIISDYFLDNAEHLARWSPAVPPGHHSAGAWRRRLEERELEFKRGMSVHFIGTTADESRMIGSCSLTNLVRGVFQACHMGYSVAKDFEGQGCMRRIVEHAIEHGFNHMGMHRIMANHMPDNERSAALLRRLGFEREGYARDFLLINGRWEDHVLNSLLKSDWQTQSAGA